MSDAQTSSNSLTLAEHEAALAARAKGRYEGEPSSAAVQAQAAQAGDCDYLLASIRCLQARLEAASDDVSWVAPAARSTPAQSLQRIRALCEMYPELFSAMLAVAVTHSALKREMLAQAIKQFRRDADAYSIEDMVSLLASLVNGAKDAFEAVQRTRKKAGRKASALPWGNATD